MKITNLEITDIVDGTYDENNRREELNEEDRANGEDERFENKASIGTYDTIIVSFNIGNNKFEGIEIQNGFGDYNRNALSAADSQGYCDSYDYYSGSDSKGTEKFNEFCEEHDLEPTEMFEKANLSEVVLTKYALNSYDEDELNNLAHCEHDDVRLILASYANKHISKDTLKMLSEDDVEIVSLSAKQTLEQFFNYKSKSQEPAKITMADVLSGSASAEALKQQQERQAAEGHSFFSKKSSEQAMSK